MSRTPVNRDRDAVERGARDAFGYEPDDDFNRPIQWPQMLVAVLATIGLCVSVYMILEWLLLPGPAA